MCELHYKTFFYDKNNIKLFEEKKHRGANFHGSEQFFSVESGIYR